MTVKLVAASPAHIGRIANRMREWDRIECAAFGRTPKQALRQGIAASSLCLTVMIDDAPEAMLGLVVTNALCGEGCPWMLGSDAIYGRPRDMVRLGAIVFPAMVDSTPRLSNIVARDNARAIRMLRHWGFSIREEVILSAGVEFVTFEMERG